MIFGIIGTPDVSVREAYVETSDTAVWYSMELEGYSEGGDELAVEVYNDFERHREPLQIEEYYSDYQEEERSPEEQNVQYAFGEVYDLRADTDYTLEVFYGSWTIYKQKIRTAKQEEPWQDDPHEDPDTGDPTRASISLEASETMIYYSGSVSDFQSSDVFVVRLFRDGDLYAQNQVTDLSPEEPYLSGEFYDLTPDTGYVVQLVKNPDTTSEYLVFEEYVWTQTEQPALLEANWMQLEPDETNLVYAISLNNYQGGGQFTVELLENGDVVREQSFEDIPVEEPYISGEFTELEYQTAYTIRLVVDQEVILTGSVFIQAPEPTFDVTANAVSYTIPLTDYNEGDWYLIVLLPGADQVDSNQVVDISPDQLSVSGEFTDLQPETEYTIQLMKNQEPVSEWTITTQSADGENGTGG